MRTYGRVPYYTPGTTIQPIDPDTGRPQTKWIVVETTPDGFNDYVYLTTLAQVLKLNPNEAPFYANYGIPGKASVVQQIAPDFYAIRTQQQFAQYFASLTIARTGVTAEMLASGKVPTGTAPGTPIYTIAATTNSGLQLSLNVPIAT